jgi:hypothetical protein
MVNLPDRDFITVVLKMFKELGEDVEKAKKTNIIKIEISVKRRKKKSKAEKYN